MFVFSRDYAANDQLDTYSDSGLNDEEDFEAMSAAQRRRAELAMEQRDRRERRGGRGARAAKRSHAPDLLMSESSDEEGLDGGLLAGTKRRARRHYDERVEVDDAAGVEAVRFLLLVACFSLS